ncbi:carbonic anhydrase [Mucilaginibacter frigoritolerans]|uniref:Carbonic anhydrase 2 n=1 Tax=Mucilaginibacter frigoritolerans TaxID=652788 RepID=A0A562TRM7_9SPHI|nr:SulP family inorganic anion transporter [Mucilaginibacter frigoritolerans]TWI95854.1 carbonic anhydrase [Mucilaginibacter frigoritolerans]
MDFSSFKNTFKQDLSAGLVVFLVALPLCLGIALASGAPLLSGIITGVAGGIVVGLISGSNLAVSGPAAGLTTIVATAIINLHSFEAFLLSVILAGVIQLVLGLVKAGKIGLYFPSSVIKGMLAAIGIILILKQIPHAFGYDADAEGDFTFLQADQSNTFSEINNVLSKLNLGAIIIFALSMAVLILWETPLFKKIKAFPSGLAVVILGVLTSLALGMAPSVLQLRTKSFVQIPLLSGAEDISSMFKFPDFSQIANPQVLVVALTIAFVASLETLLSIEAVDKLDPQKRSTPLNRELVAQGTGNIVAGLLGGIPLTAVIVRGATNVSAGAKTKVSTIFHGVLLLGTVLLIPRVLNMIPLASLAAILIMVGYKLANVQLFTNMYKAGWNQFTPFFITVVAIILTDLLKGVLIGMAVSIIFILVNATRDLIYSSITESDKGLVQRLVLSEQVTFLNKAHLNEFLNSVKPKSNVWIDASQTKYIEHDCLEILQDFKARAATEQIKYSITGLKDHYSILEAKDEKIAEHDQHSHDQHSYTELFANNRKWIAEKLHLDMHYFSKLSAGQSPQYLIVGCSDSRAPLELITGAQPGEIFSQRNIANQVIPSDTNLMAVLQYSVEVLKVKHIVICGHYGCGGVKAALNGGTNGSLDQWLSHVRDVYRIHKVEIDGITDSEMQHRRLVELNVEEQIFQLKATSIVQRALQSGQTLNFYGWVYDLTDGMLHDMQIKDIAKIPEVQPIS